MQESKFGQVAGKATGFAAKATDIRHMEERAGQSWLGQTTIGRGIRAVTVGGLANLKIGDKSLEEAHKEGEEQQTARHVINSITRARNVENELRPLREQQNQHQEGVHEAQAEQERARQALAQAQTPPPTPQRQQQIDAALAALAQAQTVSPQQQRNIAAAEHERTLRQQDLAQAQAQAQTVSPQQQQQIDAAQAEQERARQDLATDPNNRILQGIFAAAQQRLAAAQAPSPQQQQQIDAALAALAAAEQALAAEHAAVASQQQPEIARAEAALATARTAPPLTPEQQTAVTAANDALTEANTNMTRATYALQAFQTAHAHDIEALTRRKSEAYAAISPAEYVKYAPKADIINNMDLGDTPLSIYNAVMSDEHRLTEHEKEEATDNFLRRSNEVARRGGARTEQYHRDIITLQRELNRFGVRRDQIMSRLAPELRADVELAETRERELLERLARMAQATGAAAPAPQPRGTPPPGGRHP